MIISLLINIFMLISHPTNNSPPPSQDWYPMHTISLQGFPIVCIIFAGNWWNEQWFWGESMKSKHNTKFIKWTRVSPQCALFLQVIDEMGNGFMENRWNPNTTQYFQSGQGFPTMCTIFVGNWWNGQWFYGELMKSQHNTIFPKWESFCDLSMQMDDYFTTNQQN